MGGCRTRVHNPYAALLIVIGQSGRLSRGARHGDSHVRASVFPVGAQQVVPNRSVLGLQTGSVAFRGIEQCLGFVFVACRFELQILSDQRTPEKFAGQKVRVIGTLNTKTKTIQVDSITVAK